MAVIPLDTQLTIGGIIYPKMDQCDFTGPFEVLARIPNSRFVTIWKDKSPIKDMAGLQLLADTALADAPQLDVLLVPGGYGQEALMHDSAILSFIRKQEIGARYIFSVCTGALICGAAGLLHGKRATTHWTALDLLPYFGAVQSSERVVIDGKLISAGGVTAGIDGALVLAALLRGETVAQELQLYMAYEPKPPFNSGSPASAPASVLDAVSQRARPFTEQRLNTARNYQSASLAASANATSARTSPVTKAPNESAPEIDLLRAAYSAFNARNIEAALALMTSDVEWPRAFKGGFVHGPEAIRAYWTEQWSEISPHVEPAAFHRDATGRILVEVQLNVRNLKGDVLADEQVVHRFTFEKGLIRRMEIVPPATSNT